MCFTPSQPAEEEEEEEEEEEVFQNPTDEEEDIFQNPTAEYFTKYIWVAASFTWRSPTHSRLSEKICVCTCSYNYSLRIVSTDKILRFVNALIIIMCTDHMLARQ